MSTKTQKVSYSQAVLQLIQRYQQIQINQNTDKLPSIERFRELIHTDQILKMKFQGAIDQIPEEVPSFDILGKRKSVLFGMTVDEVLDLLNIAVQTPPRFLPSMFCGVPISSFFVDLMNTELGKAFFSRPDVNFYLRDIVNDYGAMLKTEKSLRYLNSEREGWLSQEALQYINYNDIVCDQSAPHYGFKCWNDWFVRDLTQGARPVAGIDDPLVIVHTTENYALTGEGFPQTNVKATDKFWLKQNRYSLYDMFQAKKMGLTELIDESFVGGTVYQGFLSPWCYHQWHSPVSGIVQKVYLLQGTLFLQNPNYDQSASSSNFPDSLTFLSCVSTRLIYIINTENEHVGRVALIKVGMTEVSSCISVVKEGDRVVKGQTIGRFQFGGSSNVVVFDKRAKLQFNQSIFKKEIKNGRENPTLQRVNSELARVII